MADDLYDRDFYLWTQAQAEALRTRSTNALDYEKLAEEVGDLGKSDRNRCFSLTSRILEHMLMLASTRREEPRGHWRAEVRAFRASLRLTLSPSIRADVERSIEQLHVEAAEIVADKFSAIEPGAPILSDMRWTLAQVLGEENDPLG